MTKQRTERVEIDLRRVEGGGKGSQKRQYNTLITQL